MLLLAFFPVIVNQNHLSLLVAGDHLFALALARDGFHVVGLDLGGKGECSFRSAVVVTPRWVVPLARAAPAARALAAASTSARMPS